MIKVWYELVLAVGHDAWHGISEKSAKQKIKIVQNTDSMLVASVPFSAQAQIM